MKEMIKEKKYLIEIVLFFTYALFAMSWKAGDILIAGYGFNATQSAFMTNAITIAKIIGSLSTVMIISKFGNRKTFIISTLLIAVGVFLPFTKLFSLIFIIRFILGLGGALILVTINPIVAKLFKDKELTIVNGLNAVAFNVGLAIVFTFYKQIKSNPTMVIQIISLLLLLFIGVWLYLTKSLKEESKKSSKEIIEYTMKDGLKEKFNWIFALSYSGLLSFYLVAFSFMRPENVLWVIYAGIIGALVGTFTANKVTNKLKLIRVSSFLQFLCAVGFILYRDYEIAKFMGFLLGFFIFMPMAAYVTLAFTRRDATPKKISVTFSIFWAVSYGVSVLVIQLFGIIKDNSSSLNSPLIFILFVEATFFIGTTFFMKDEEKIEEVLI